MSDRPDALRERLAAAPLGFGGAPRQPFRVVADDVAAALVRHATRPARAVSIPRALWPRPTERRSHAPSLPRDSYLLSTKVGRRLEPSPNAPRDQHGYVDTLPFTQRYDYTADGVRRSLDDSLQRLGLARVDIVYVHDIDRATHGEAHSRRLADALDGGLPALAQLRASGAIGGYGLGVNDVAICLDVLRYADLDVILLAGRYTLLDQSALVELLPECLRRGVAIGSAVRSIGHSRHRRGPLTDRRCIQLRASDAGDHRPRCRDRTSVRSVRRASQGSGVAISTRPSCDRQRDPGRPLVRRVRRQSAPREVADTGVILADAARSRACCARRATADELK
jgi:hypothetical protein